jgi:hypothetical protein
VNLASRLNAIAGANEIVTSQDVLDVLPNDLFEFSFLGKKSLKGFEQDVIKCYSIRDFKQPQKNLSTGSAECPSCQQGILYIDTNEIGHFVFKCRHCGFLQTDVGAA